MRKIVLNISDATYERLRAESILEQKSIEEIIRERIFEKPFSNEVENAFDEWLQQQINNF